MWRLLLGRFADEGLGQPLAGHGEAERRDRVLEYLYGREYGGRGVRDRGEGREGGAGDSVLYVPEWLREVRDLFPRDTVDVIERHALKNGLIVVVSEDHSGPTF